jgi:L-ascorbate metabolism protein UlaG (beta-lactamase superfamily)
MRMRRLGWAGIELEAGEARLIVDHVLDPGILSGFLGEERDELIAPAPGVRAALVTHLHRDHTDVPAIERALASDGLVLRPQTRKVETKFDEIVIGEAERALGNTSLNVRACQVGDTVQIGPFSVIAVFASDGLGSPQVSWLIEADGQRVFHGGDTLWHGSWWDIALAGGPIDIACLPANGVEISYPHLQPPAGVPAVMTPDQAVEAARALRARLMIPIHYNRTFEHRDYYRPVTDAREQIEALAAKREADVLFLEPGDWHDIEVDRPRDPR